MSVRHIQEKAIVQARWNEGGRTWREALKGHHQRRAGPIETSRPTLSAVVSLRRWGRCHQIWGCVRLFQNTQVVGVMLMARKKGVAISQRT
jgi:hypothetical protein